MREWTLPQDATGEECVQTDGDTGPLRAALALSNAVPQIGQPEKKFGENGRQILGKADTKDCFVRKMDRLRKKAGITAKAGEQVVLYSYRHTFGTENTGKVSDIELAELMGHTEVRTTHRYVHLNADRLHDIRRRAHG